MTATINHHCTYTAHTRKSRLAAAATTGAVGVVSWAGVHIGNADLAVGTRTVGLGAVATASLVAAATSWASLAVLERICDDRDAAMRMWRRFAVAVGVISLLGPLTADASWPDRWSLLAIHASVAVTALAAFSTRTRSARCTCAGAHGSGRPINAHGNGTRPTGPDPATTAMRDGRVV